MEHAWCIDQLVVLLYRVYNSLASQPPFTHGEKGLARETMLIEHKLKNNYDFNFSAIFWYRSSQFT